MTRLNLMGNRNVERVLFARPPLTTVPWASLWCLCLMAKTAHDDTQLYYGGVGWLQLQMGYTDGPSGRRAVMRHLVILETAGYVRRTDKRQGHRAIYELRIPGLVRPPSTGG